VLEFCLLVCYDAIRRRGCGVNMIKHESILEDSNFIKLPDQLCEQWDLAIGTTLYSYINNKKLVLTKEPQRNASSFIVIPGFYIILPDYLAETMSFHVDCKISFTLENNNVLLSKSRKLHLYSPTDNPISELDESNREESLKKKTTFSLELEDFLRIKVEHELEIYNEQESSTDYMQLLTDIGMHINFSSWSEEEIEGMLGQKNLLKELAWKFLDDAEYNELFYKKISEFASSYRISKESKRFSK